MSDSAARFHAGARARAHGHVPVRSPARRRPPGGQGGPDPAAPVPLHERPAAGAVLVVALAVISAAAQAAAPDLHRPRGRWPQRVPGGGSVPRHDRPRAHRRHGAGAGAVSGGLAHQRRQPLRAGGGRPATAAEAAQPDHAEGAGAVADLLRPQRGRRPVVAAHQRHRGDQPHRGDGAVAHGVQLPAVVRDPDRHAGAQLAAGAGQLHAAATDVREHGGVLEARPPRVPQDPQDHQRREHRAGAEHLRRPHRAGVQPPVVELAELPPAQSRQPRRQRRRRVADGGVRPDHGRDQRHRHCRGADLRRLSRPPGTGDHRRDRGLPAVRAPVLRAGARHIHAVGAATVLDRRRRADLRAARRAAADRGRSGCQTAGSAGRARGAA